MEFGKGSSNRKKSAFVILNRLYNRLDRLSYVRHIYYLINLWITEKKLAFIILNQFYNTLDRLPHVRHIFFYITLWNLGRELQLGIQELSPLKSPICLPKNRPLKSRPCNLGLPQLSGRSKKIGLGEIPNVGLRKIGLPAPTRSTLYESQFSS